MSVGQTIILRGNRETAHRMVDVAPMGAVLNIKPASRSNAQNARMWALLSEISRVKPEGRELTPEVWKSLFCHALGHAQRFEMALDGNGVVPVGFRTSRMSKEQMGDLMTIIEEYGARHGVWKEERNAA